ncbi:MAG: RES family NAD+ phosphorylase [Cytophagales bacterium]
MILYRIAEKKYAEDLSGNGAALYGGRWNPKDVPILYCASSVALASLEVLIRFHESNRSSNLHLIVINIGNNDSIQKIESSNLSLHWIEQIDETKKIGQAWSKSNQSMMLEVPSAIVPIDKNYLLNPNHSNYSQVEIIDIVPYQFDNRLFKTHVF